MGLSAWIGRQWSKSKWFFVYEIFNFGYDKIFYPYAIFHWGIVKGSLIGVAGSLVICVFLFWLYDHMRLDWLRAEEIRQLEGDGRRAWYQKLLIWFGKRKRSAWEKILSPIVFILLTSRIDPLIVAVHYKHQHFVGLKSRDWLVLYAAVALANAWWILQIGTLIEFAKFAWNNPDVVLDWIANTVQQLLQYVQAS